MPTRDIVLASVLLVWSSVTPLPPREPQEAAQASKADDKPAFKTEELEQMLAPIALYPDDLLTQVLMATTYPLEIVQADRWAKANKGKTGDAAAKALEAQPWDASVKSLVNFPDVLALLSDKLDWTQKLGDAFIGQQKEVMDTIQKLRAKAKEAGKLESNEDQKIEVKQEGTTEVIVIQSANPQVVYVPVYDPVVVYGGWPYPAYPPYPYYPPAYAAGVGIAVGFAWGYAWGSCNWGHSDVDIDINRNTNINNNIDRTKYQNRGQGGSGGGKWNHDPSHRAGVPYRDKSASQRYGGKTATQATQARESFRGRGGASSLDAPGAGRTGASGARPTAGARTSAGQSGSRASSNALGGVRGGGQAARASSSRGNASRASAGGGSRGGSRGGGGRRR